MLSFSLPLVMSAGKSLNCVTPSCVAVSMMSWALAMASG